MIRDAEPSDFAAIRALMQSVVGFWDESWRADVLERALAAAGTLALVFEEGSTLEGFVCAHDLGFRGYVSELVVSPSARHRRIGSRLLSEAERRLAERGCGVVIADVWRDAEGFYRANGWSSPSVVLQRKRLAPRG